MGKKTTTHTHTNNLPSMGFSRQEYWSGLPFPSPWDLPNPEIEPRSPTLQADALTSEPPGKPKYFFGLLFLEGSGGKNTGVGYHSLLQEISPTQGLNPGLPHCRQTLYCLNHQGSYKMSKGPEQTSFQRTLHSVIYQQYLNKDEALKNVPLNR